MIPQVRHCIGTALWPLRLAGVSGRFLKGRFDHWRNGRPLHRLQSFVFLQVRPGAVGTLSGALAWSIAPSGVCRRRLGCSKVMG